MSLVASVSVFGFFVIAPALGFPLGWEQSTRLLELVIPVFVGYLGAAAHYLFQRPRVVPKALPSSDLLSLITFGPVAVFLIGSVTVLLVFGYSNRASALPGEGMNIDVLSALFTVLLGLLTVTTNVAVSYFFSLESDSGLSGQG